MEAKLQYKNGAVYREIMRSPKIDWCQMMSDKKENPLIEQFMIFLRDNVPSIIHGCPYTV